MIYYYNCKGKLSEVQEWQKITADDKFLIDAGYVDFIVKLDKEKDYIEMIMENRTPINNTMNWKYTKATKEEVKRYHQYKKAYKLMNR